MTEKGAVLKVFYEQWPDGPGGVFVQVRQWETGDGEHVDLLLECGRVDAFGELTTETRPLPFYSELVDLGVLLAGLVTMPAASGVSAD